AAGFGGYRESGFGREGGREGMWEYLKPAWETANAERGTRNEPAATVPRSEFPVPRSGQLPDIDRTPKLFIGGKQVRPDQAYSRQIVGPDGQVVGEAGEGNRKDIRNAVEAAHAAAGWAQATGHVRAQTPHYIAENLAPRQAEFPARSAALTRGGDVGCPRRRDQHRERRDCHPRAGARRTPGRGRHVVLRRGRRQGGRACLGGEHEAHVGGGPLPPPRLARSLPGGGPRVPAPRDA